MTTGRAMTPTRTETTAAIARLLDVGLDAIDVAARLGVGVSRVERVLDDLAEGRLKLLPVPASPPARTAQPTRATVTPAAPPAPPRPTVLKRRSRAECGTYTGFNRHKRRGEPICDPCRAAMKRQQAIWRARARRRRIRAAGHVEVRRDIGDWAVICTACDRDVSSFDLWPAAIAAAFDHVKLHRAAS